MVKYDDALQKTLSAEPCVETVYSERDATQDSLVQNLKTFRKHGREGNASNERELRELIGSDVGLFVNTVNQRIIDNARSQKTWGTVSIDAAHEETVYVEDETAERDFAHVEAKEALNDFLSTLHGHKKEAVIRFIEAFEMQESGQRVPDTLRKRIRRDANLYGFAFRLT